MKVKYLDVMLLALAFVVFVFVKRAEADSEVVSLTVNNSNLQLYQGGTVAFPILSPTQGGSVFGWGFPVGGQNCDYCILEAYEVYDPSNTLVAQFVLDLAGQPSHDDLEIEGITGDALGTVYLLPPSWPWTIITEIPGQTITLSLGQFYVLGTTEIFRCRNL